MPAEVLSKKLPEIEQAIEVMGPITTKQLSELSGCGLSTVNRAIHEIRRKRKDLQSSRVGYSFVPSVDRSEFSSVTEIVEHDESDVNPPDTSAKPFKPSKMSLILDEGRIVYRENDKNHLYLIVGKHGKYIYCLPLVYRSVDRPSAEEYTSIFGNWAVSISGLTSFDVTVVPLVNRSLEGFLSCSLNKLNILRKDVQELFGEIEVETDDIIKLSKLEYELLKQKAALYEDAFRTVCGGAKDVRSGNYGFLQYKG